MLTLSFCQLWKKRGNYWRKSLHSKSQSFISGDMVSRRESGNGALVDMYVRTSAFFFSAVVVMVCGRYLPGFGLRLRFGNVFLPPNLEPHWLHKVNIEKENYMGRKCETRVKSFWNMHLKIKGLLQWTNRPDSFHLVIHISVNVLKDPFVCFHVVQFMTQSRLAQFTTASAL